MGEKQMIDYNALYNRLSLAYANSHAKEKADLENRLFILEKQLVAYQKGVNDALTAIEDAALREENNDSN